MPSNATESWNERRAAEQKYDRSLTIAGCLITAFWIAVIAGSIEGFIYLVLWFFGFIS